MSTTLYDKYGGSPAVSMVVKDFYRRLMDDSAVSGFFSNVSMPKSIAHQTNFVARALGGPEVYEGRDLKLAHARLEVDDSAFGSVAGHLSAALIAGGFSEEDAGAVISLVATLKDDVVTAKAE